VLPIPPARFGRSNLLGGKGEGMHEERKLGREAWMG